MCLAFHHVEAVPARQSRSWDASYQQHLFAGSFAITLPPSHKCNRQPLRVAPRGEKKGRVGMGVTPHPDPALFYLQIYPDCRVLLVGRQKEPCLSPTARFLTARQKNPACPPLPVCPRLAFSKRSALANGTRWKVNYRVRASLPHGARHGHSLAGVIVDRVGRDRKSVRQRVRVVEGLLQESGCQFPRQLPRTAGRPAPALRPEHLPAGGRVGVGSPEQGKALRGATRGIDRLADQLHTRGTYHAGRAGQQPCPQRGAAGPAAGQRPTPTATR